MNNPFHRAAVKAVADAIEAIDNRSSPFATFEELRRDLVAEFERRLEHQAKAFDACKRGSEISMTALQHEMSKALSAYRKRAKLDGNILAAERAFNDHMKPHLEIRLW